jgi:putative selenium metabolism hydrolase
MEVVPLLQDLVGIDSTPGREGHAIERAAEEMQRQGFDDVTVDAAGTLVGRIGPASGPTLVLDAHVDTVPVHDPTRWTHDPFGGQVVDGRLYGRGTTDMKGAVAALICAGGRVKASGVPLAGPALVVVSIAEEMREGATLARTLDGQRVDWCVIGEATSLEIATAQRGRAKVAVKLRGRSAHAATVGLGVNAAEAMTRLVGAVTGVRSAVHPLLGSRQVSLIDVHSEPYPSISTIPDYCVAHFDVRFLPGESREAVLDLLERAVPDGVEATVRVAAADFETYVGDRFELDDLALAWETSRDDPLVRRAHEATGAPLGTYLFATNGSYVAGELGIPTIGYGPGSPEQAHVDDEFVAVSEVVDATEGYTAIITAMLGPG